MGGVHGENHPVAWYHEYEGGRISYTALGHTEECWSIEYASGHSRSGTLLQRKMLLQSSASFSMCTEVMTEAQGRSRALPPPKRKPHVDCSTWGFKIDTRRHTAPKGPFGKRSRTVTWERNRGFDCAQPDDFALRRTYETAH
ncbi:MAG: ThuA domain-containing protein [Ignavibacteria bacterium]|nr:ThuA domain-containing protein [Ignavibacteria bacterium]